MIYRLPMSQRYLHPPHTISVDPFAILHCLIFWLSFLGARNNAGRSPVEKLSYKGKILMNQGKCQLKIKTLFFLPCLSDKGF